MDKDAASMIEAHNLRKLFHLGSEEIAAVNDVTLSVREGDFVSFIGPSGSGKTTLINILGCLDNPTSGELRVAGREIFDHGKTLSEAELTKIRRELFGYIFQKFYLIPTLTVLENVVLPFTFYRKPGAESEVDKLLQLLGIEHRKHHLPGQISGGGRCSAWPSPEPWSINLRSSWPMSLRVIWIPGGARRLAIS